MLKDQGDSRGVDESDAYHQERAREFFDFFRRRVAIATALETVSAKAATRGVEPDRSVLIAAGIDALANYWSRVFCTELSGRRQGARRMGEFLLRHGDRRIFAKCSMPYLLGQATRLTVPQADEVMHEALLAAIRRYLGNEGPEGTVRTWEDDPDFTDTLKDPDLVTRADCFRLDIRLGRYGELLYKDYRCSWLHELQPSRHLAHDSDRRANEPRYQNLSTWIDGEDETNSIQVQRPMFTREFLLKTYDAVVTSFEQQCTLEHRCPIQDDDE